MGLFVEEKPIKRSSIRKILGMKYYQLKRFKDWHFSKKIFSKDKTESLYPYIIFSHKTPLIRELRSVDMHLQYNKITNLNIATKKINGIIIKPGQTFSYWKLIGKPSYRKGYLDGLVLAEKGSFKSGVVGGLCQLSNLIYWMALHSPLSVTERHRHSHDVFPDENRTQPFGTGATCSYNSLDLQIFNGTKSDYQLIVYLTKEELVGELRSIEAPMNKYKVYEREHSITPSFFGGYIRNNTIYRKIFNKSFGLIKDEYITENHAYMMYSPILTNGESMESK
jgi:vancomycin resistance protein VanW